MQPLWVKLAFDGATMTSGKRIQQEIGTVEVLTDRTISQVKSYKNSHQWLIYLGAENNDILGEELQRAIPVIEKLNKDKKVAHAPITIISDTNYYLRSLWMV